MTRLEHISTPNASAPFASYSQAVAWDRIVTTAGKLGTDPLTSTLPEAFADEVSQASTNLESVLKAAGSDLGSVMKTTCFISDMSLFRKFDAVYRERMPHPLPARSALGIQFAGDFRFEIEAIAVRSA